MLEVNQAGAQTEQKSKLKDLCIDLFNEWSCGLTYEEQTVWLWNAKVEMVRIKQKRKSLMAL